MMKTRRAALTFLVVLGLIRFLSGTSHAEEISARGFILHAEGFDRADCPVIIELPKSLQGTTPLAVVDVSQGTKQPAQRMEDGRLAFILREPLAAGRSRNYLVVPSPGEDAAPNSAAMTCSTIDGRIELGLAQKPPKLVYQMAVAEPPRGLDPRYRRSGFIHPVFTPQGRIVTEAFPADHAHQHAIFAAWVKTEFAGRHVDFWNQLEGTGAVEHRRLLKTHAGPVFGEFQVNLAAIDLSAPGGPRDALDEEWTVRAFAVESGNLFEIETCQRCAGTSPLTLEKYHYGGMAARGAQSWKKGSDFDFLTNAGMNRETGNQSRANWVAMHGSVEGGPSSLTVFSHPANFRSPQPVRLHPSMPYFVFSPPILGEFQITPDQPYQARYRYFAQDGAVDPQRLAAIWNDYSQPPRIEWQP